CARCSAHKSRRIAPDLSADKPDRSPSRSANSLSGSSKFPPPHPEQRPPHRFPHKLFRVGHRESTLRDAAHLATALCPHPPRSIRRHASETNARDQSSPPSSKPDRRHLDAIQFW